MSTVFGSALDFESSATSAVPPGAPAARGQQVRWQQAVVAMGRRVAAMPDLPVILHDAAMLLAEMLDLPHCGIAELEPDGQTLSIRIMLDARQPRPRALTQQHPWPGGATLAGYAMQVAHPVAVPNLAEEPCVAAPLLRRNGVGAAIAVPLSVHGATFGALLAAGNQPREFPEEDVLFAEALAHLVSSGIARHRAEQSLAVQQRLSAEMLQTLEALVVLLDPQGRIQRINKMGQRITGFTAAEIVRRPIAQVFPVDGESNLFTDIFDKLRQGISPLHYESRLRTKDGSPRWIAWTYSAVHGDDGAIESILATGLDHTAQRETEVKLQQAEQAKLEAHRQLELLLPNPVAPSDANVEAAREAAMRAVSPVIVGGLDRRDRARQPYPYRQFVGPILAGQLPDRRRLVKVLCRDIAPGGVSFLSPTPPVADSFVVALGRPPRLTYLTASVAHVTRVEHEGRKMYLIGCNYTGRAGY